MTDSILSSFGLGPPNPASFSDASAVAKQKKAAITTLQGIVSAMNTSLVVAKTAGFPGDIVDKINTHVNNGNALLSDASTMTPAALQAKISNLESEFAATQFKQTTDEYNNLLSDLQEELKIIQARVDDINKDPGITKEIQTKYDTLLKNIKNDIDTLIKSPPVFIPITSQSEPFQSGGGSDEGSAKGSASEPYFYEIPKVTLASEYKSQLEILNEELQIQEEDAGFSFSNMYKRTKKWMGSILFVVLFYIIIGISFILGGIIMSNAYLEVESKSPLNRLFYFVYGGIFYPVSLIYACLPGKPTSILQPWTAWPGQTPYWSATVFPAYQRDIGPPTVMPEEIQAPMSGGAFDLSSLSSLLSSLSPFLPASAQNILNQAQTAVTNIISPEESPPTKDPGKFSGIRESYIKDTVTGVITTNQVPPGTFDLFSYAIPDGKRPAPYQVTGRTQLLTYSAVFLILNILLGIKYKMV